MPAGSAIILVTGAANRDESMFANGESFDINRERVPHLTFGYGVHSCLGNALARIEGRIALDEVLNRFPEWDVDLDNAHLSPTSTVRGWETLPTFLGGARASARRGKSAHGNPAQQPSSGAKSAAPADGAEVWNLTLNTPMGVQSMTARIVRQGEGFTGSISGEMGEQNITGNIAGSTLTWTLPLTKPVAIKLGFEATVAGDSMTGNVKLGMFGNAPLTGKRA